MKRVKEPELMTDKEQAIAYANANFELKLQILFAFIIKNYDFTSHS